MVSYVQQIPGFLQKKFYKINKMVLGSSLQHLVVTLCMSKLGSVCSKVLMSYAVSKFLDPAHCLHL